MLGRYARCMSTAAPSRNVGFVGLGNMGGHMAANLLKAGHQVTVFDLNAQALSRAEAQGAAVANTPKDVAAAADIVITMLPSSPHVRSVYTGDNGIFEGARPHSLFIDSSTIDPETAQDVAAQAKKRGMEMVDAPVSGGVGGAEAGTLTFMLGGSKAGYSQALDVLNDMGSNVVHCGGNGTGQGAKIANNLVLAVSMVAVSEGMNLGAKLGMDPKVLAGIFNTSTARCWSSDTYNPCPGVMEGVPASRGYTGGFGVDLMKKDLGLAVDAAKSANANAPLTALVHQLYGCHSSSGNGAKDFSSIFQWISGVNKNE